VVERVILGVVHTTGLLEAYGKSWSMSRAKDFYSILIEMKIEGRKYFNDSKSVHGRRHFRQQLFFMLRVADI
jgi:hypothetical protein